MNWSSMEKRVVLLACALAIAGSCCIAACDATPAGNQAQAALEGDDADAGAQIERRSVDAQGVQAYLQGADFRMGDVRLGAAFGAQAEEAAHRDELEVHVSEGGVWVLETCRESAEERARAEGEIANALVCRLSAPAGECGPLALPWLKATDAVGLKVMEAMDGKLTEVRACVLACSLATATLEEDETGEDGGAEGEGARDASGAEPARLEVPEGALVAHVPRTPATAEVTWVVVREDGGGETQDGKGNEADRDGSAAGDAGTSRPGAASSADTTAPGSNPGADTTGDNDATDGNAPANPQPSGPVNPGDIDVTERPSGGQPGSGSGAGTGTTPPPQPEEPKRTWVVDKPAWDERVMTSQAWDEQVWVSVQEWVPNNVWVVDQAAWDEQVVVREGYYETVRTTSHYRFAADDYITYDEADLAEHTKYLMSQGLPTNYYVEWEHEQVWHEPEYTTVHHDEQGHWEDHGSYQDKGYYQTIHHEAEYTIVHHEEEGHWE